MRAAVALPSAALMLAVALPASAQGERENPTGSLIGRGKAAVLPGRAGISDIDRARLVVDAFADCSVTNEKRKAVAYRDKKYDDPEASKLMSALVSSDCLMMDGRLSMPDELLRGAIFKAFYRREIKAGDVPFQEKEVDFATYLNDVKAPASQRYLILLDFAGCVARADAANSRAFVLAEPGSSQEKTALTALQPQFGPCFPAGANVTLNKSIVSAVLAEALYREATSAQTVVAEASH